MMPSASISRHSDDSEVEGKNKHGEEWGLWASSELLLSTSQDVSDLLLSPSRTIPILEEPPSSLSFLRDYVSKSVPCIIRNAFPDPGNCNRSLTLTLDELLEICRDEEEARILLSVDVTADGHGDCVRTVRGRDGTSKRMFVMPDQRSMTLSEFRAQLRRPIPVLSDDVKAHNEYELDEDGRRVLRLEKNDDPGAVEKEDRLPTNEQVVYYSKQNDCMRTELRPLFESGIFPQAIPFAEEAFGTGPPDAVNLWIGNEEVTSSMHKDHYENMFYVLSGEKVFTLCPPCDAPFLSPGQFESGRFRQEEATGAWVVVSEHGEDCEHTEDNQSIHSSPRQVQWIEADVERRYVDPNRHVLLSLAHPLQVRVQEGEMLYLPSLWFHKVTQSCETVGVNYWYDMKFDSPLWCYFNFVQQLQAREVGSTSMA